MIFDKHNFEDSILSFTDNVADIFLKRAKLLDEAKINLLKSFGFEDGYHDVKIITYNDYSFSVEITDTHKFSIFLPIYGYAIEHIVREKLNPRWNTSSFVKTTKTHTLIKTSGDDGLILLSNDKQVSHDIIEALEQEYQLDNIDLYDDADEYAENDNDLDAWGICTEPEEEKEVDDIEIKPDRYIEIGGISENYNE